MSFIKKAKHVRPALNQLSESEESDEEENKTGKKVAPSSGRKYIPPKIAPMHYGSYFPVLISYYFIIVLANLVELC